MAHVRAGKRILVSDAAIDNWIKEHAMRLYKRGKILVGRLARRRARVDQMHDGAGGPSLVS